ncbi:MAG: rhomboid family intramembrane serine protease [Planctomycetota bacterium]
MRPLTGGDGLHPAPSPLRYDGVMGIYDREYYRDSDDYDGPAARLLRTWVARLIALNVVVFVANFLLYPPSSNSPEWLTEVLALTNKTVGQPLTWWRFVTYSVAHQDWHHLLFNMLGLWVFGGPIERSRGGREFFWIYWGAAILGGIVWAIRNLVWSANHGSVIGASGAVTALVILFVCQYPRQQVLLMGIVPVPAWLMGIVLIGRDLVQVFDRSSHVAVDVHLAGAAFALVYFRQNWHLSGLLPGQFRSDKGADSKRRNSATRGGWRKLFSRRPQLRVFGVNQEEQRESEAVLDAEADQILAKLHAQGDAALNEDDRSKLDAYSRRLREKRR